MSETMRYFDKEDILHLVIKQGKEASSVEMSPNITVELDEKGEMIGIEIQNATHFIRDGLLESIQAKILQNG
jgi:uncharacterized protein YuzE